LAGSCAFKRRDEGTVLMTVTKVDDAMYIFGGRPWTSADTIVTSFFVTYAFDNIFNSTLYDVAISFNSEEWGFGGPLLTAIIDTDIFVRPGQSGGGRKKRKPVIGYEYTLRQTASQETTAPMDEAFGVFLNSSINQTSVVFDQCVIMIGDAIPSSTPTDASPSGARTLVKKTNEASSAFFRPKFDLAAAEVAVENVGKVLQKEVAVIPPKQDKVSNWVNFKKNHGISYSGKAVDSKDYINGLANGLKSLAQTIKTCTVSCNEQTIVDGVGSILWSVAFVAGAACPIVGVVLAALGTLSMVTAIFLPGVRTSSIPPLTANDVQRAVENVLSQYSTTEASYEFEAIETFANIDVDIYKNFLNHLNYINQTRGDEAQAEIDKQIDHWSKQWLSAWSDYLGALRSLEKEFKAKLGGSSSTSIRDKLRQWISGCNTRKCELYGSRDIIDNANRDLSACYKDMVDGRNNYGLLLSFSNAYMSVAFKIFDLVVAVIAIFQHASDCYDDPFSTDCNWGTFVQEYAKKMFQITERAFYLQDVMKLMNEDCNPTYSGWPFTQTCSSSKCNYKYGLVSSVARSI